MASNNDVQTFGIAAGLVIRARVKEVQIPLLVDAIGNVVKQAILNSSQMKEMGVTVEAGLTGLKDYKAMAIDGDEKFDGSLVPHGSFKKEHERGSGRKNKGGSGAGTVPSVPVTPDDGQ